VLEWTDLLENETNSRGGKVEIVPSIDKLFILGNGAGMDKEVVEKMDRVCRDRQ
jgi:hypothetical protein